MNESNLWGWLRDVALPLGHYSRIESPDTAPGFPDVHYTLPGRKGMKGRTGTLELKYARHKNPPFPDSDSGLRLSQLRWISHEVRTGGTVWIIAEIPKHLSVSGMSTILCLRGADARYFNGADVSQLVNLSVQVLLRDDPQDAAHRLKELLYE